jgi:hypothetical protein
VSDESENTPEIIKSPEARVEVSADLLHEAVTQLRKLTELRQREAERQERSIAQMHKAIKRQGILSRYVILTCTLAVLISVGLAYLINDNSKKADVTAQSLMLVDDSIAKTARAMDKVSDEVSTTREAQARLTDEITRELSATRETQSSVIQKVEEQLGAVREERDQIRGEVRTVLEEKTREITDKELALAGEREAIVEASKRSKEEQKALIQQTIERLAAMQASLIPEEEAPANTPSDSEIEEAVSAAEEIVEDTTGILVEPETIEQPEPGTEESPKSRKKR